MAGGRIIPGVISLDETGVGGSVGARVPGGVSYRNKNFQPDLRRGAPGLENRFYKRFIARGKEGGELSPDELVKQILYFVEIQFLLKTISTSFLPRIVEVGTTPTRITIPARYPKAYLFLNPAEVAGVASNFTFYASAARANGFNTPSTAITVSGVDRVAAFLDITAITASPTLTVDAQTQDPLTGNWATSQQDIFASANTVGTNYALVGQLGVDRIMRLLATVGDAAGDDITFSVSGLAKGSAVGPVGGTVFIGDRNVNTTMGIRILPGQERSFYLLENVELWAVTSLDTLNLMVWELQ